MKQYKSGTHRQREGYKSFSPSTINHDFEIIDPQITLQSEAASHALGELNAYSNLIPEIDFFIHMHMLKEATTSSKIEGTITEFDEALLDEDDVLPERRNDWKEVQNYTKAMNYAIERLDSLPLSTRLLCETHKVLMSGVRGERKNPGEIRKSQNWIGGSAPGNAFFVPPHHEEVPDLLGDLEKFLHNDNLHISPLMKAAIAHYQFETIHPFLDGNGRMGRLLITLFLVDQKILTKPTLYLSDFFSQHKGSYYDSLTMVRASSDITQWIKFFLTGVKQTANKSKSTFQDIIRIRQGCENRIAVKGIQVQKRLERFKILFSHPIVDSALMQKLLGITHPTANTLLKDFTELNILKEKTGFKRNKVFVFQEYLDIFMN